MVFILAKYNQHLHYTVTANTEAIEKMDVWRNKSFRPNHFHCIFLLLFVFLGFFATVTWVNCTKCTA